MINFIPGKASLRDRAYSFGYHIPARTQKNCFQEWAVRTFTASFRKNSDNGKAESAITQTVSGLRAAQNENRRALFIFEHNMKLSDIMTTGTIIMLI